MKNSRMVPQKSNKSNCSPTDPNSSYPHAYLNSNDSQSNYLMHQSYNNFQPNYMPNYNHYYQYQSFQSHPAQMMPSNFNNYQSANFNVHQMPQNFHPNNNFQQNRQFNQHFGNAPYNRNNHGSSPYQNNKNNKNNNNRNQNQQKNKFNNQNSQKTINLQDEFYCESCDRSFKVEEKFKEHCMTHTTCNVNGCKFTAAAKLVEIHFKNFHASGLDKKVTSLETPEEIQKYINERKNNKNLEEKVKFNDEKTSRGAVLNTQQYGRFNKRKFDNVEKGDFKKLNSNENGQSESQPLNANKSNNIKNNRNKKKRNKKNFLQKKKNALKYELTKPTLLQKLLADDIRHERNIILQCVKYVVEQNFFEKTTENNAPSSSSFENVLKKEDVLDLKKDEIKTSEIIAQF